MFCFYLEKHDHPAAPNRWINGISPENPDIAGHRRRMRDKVIDKSAATLTELELLEMIFIPAILAVIPNPWQSGLCEN